MAKKRVTRKQLLKEPDEFITLTSRVIQWCRQNPKLLTYGGCAIVVLVILGIGIRTYSDHRSKAAFALLGQGMKQIESMAQGTDANLDTIKPDFDRLLAKYGRQPAGRIGRVIYAHLQLTKGSPDEAIELYRKALEDYAHEPALTNIIYNGLASAYEEKEMVDEAISNFEKIAESKETVLKDNALFQLGRLYALAGQTEKSQQNYSRLVNDFPNSVYAPMAKEAQRS